MGERDGDGVFGPQAPFAPIGILGQKDAAADILARQVEEGLDRLQDRRFGAGIALALEQRDHSLELGAHGRHFRTPCCGAVLAGVPYIFEQIAGIG